MQDKEPIPSPPRSTAQIGRARRNSRRLILLSLLGRMIVVLSTSGISLEQLGDRALPEGPGSRQGRTGLPESAGTSRQRHEGGSGSGIHARRPGADRVPDAVARPGSGAAVLARRQGGVLQTAGRAGEEAG